MSTLTITGSTQSGADIRGGHIPAPQMPPTEEQSVAITGSSLGSAAFNALTRMIRVNCDVNCCLAFGPGAAGNPPTAVVGFHRLGANETAYYTVYPGDYLAVIASPT